MTNPRRIQLNIGKVQIMKFAITNFVYLNEYFSISMPIGKINFNKLCHKQPKN